MYLVRVVSHCFSLDAKTMLLLVMFQRVLDHENYIADLDEANLDEDREPRFFLLYTAKDEYG